MYRVIAEGALPFLVPELRDEFLVALAQRRLLISSDQSTAVQEELGEWGTAEDRVGEEFKIYYI